MIELYFQSTFSRSERFSLILLRCIYIDMNSCSNCYNSILVLSYVFYLKEYKRRATRIGDYARKYWL